MKRFFALLLVLLMLLPAIVACGSEETDDTEDTSVPTTTTTKKDETPGSSQDPSTGNSTQPSTPGSSGTGNSSNGGSTGDDDPVGPEPYNPPETITKWKGKTVNILATTWYSEAPGAPWSQVELTVGPDDWFSEAGFGATINAAVLQRADFIKETYGVDLEWINARGTTTANLLYDAMGSGSQGTKYHIAMPRMLEAQILVENGSIFNVANSKYIDLDQPYYNQVARESYTINGITLFVAGDFSFLDEQTSFLVYYNEAMADGFDNFPDLYQLVREGKWTIDQMKNVARLVSKNVGDVEWTDDDEYGFGTNGLGRYYQYCGIQQVSVKNGEYVLSLQDDKVGPLIDKILEIVGSDWARTSWTGSYGAMQEAFLDGRLLFYDEVIQKTDYFTNQSDTFKVGVLPGPKLSESQEKYYTPCANQAVLMCIPKSTDNRDMSEYFFEILSYTGREYVMDAYKTNVRSKLNPKTASDSMDIIEKHIFANLCFDQGYMQENGLLTSVQYDAFKDGKNNFKTAYEGAVYDATVTVSAWNENWASYVDY